MTGMISVLFKSSYAAVSPAGPAPIIIAVFLMVGLYRWGKKGKRKHAEKDWGEIGQTTF
jgi:hypothetical protein